jgi:hypothetical protein
LRKARSAAPVVEEGAQRLSRNLAGRCWDHRPMAGYSGTPLATKIGIKDEHVVFLDGAPEDLELDTGAATVVRRLPKQVDVTLTFHTTYAGLESRLPTLFDRTSTAGMVWVCWPKKAAQKAQGIVSDIDENRVRDLGLDLGFVDVKVAAVDDIWSGLKFVRRLTDRG